ncbi:hypothetical protein EBT25_05105 [bacterium]|nr:hypothetical protein [bacterium]
MDDVWCWWCCHPFEGTPVHAPYRYDDRRKYFDTTGHFCSWECAKAYIFDQGGPRAGEKQMLLALMRQHAAKKYVPTKAAPSRLLLKQFGGPLSIEEFRSGSSNAQVYMPYETHKIPTVIVSNAVPAKKTGDESGELVLKRPKPLARAKSTLETSLGITRRSKE